MSLFANIRINVDGEAPRAFATLALENIDNLAPAFQVVAENIRAFESKVFATQGQRLLGRQWQALAASTVSARAHRWGYYRAPSDEKPTRKILHWRHVLRDSLAEKGAEFHIEEIGPHKLVFGTAVEYAKYHREKRKFLGLPAAFVKTDVIPPIALYLRGRDPRSGQGQRTTRRRGRQSQPIPETL